MDTFLIILSIILLVIGLIGSVIPVIPGPPLSYLGMLLLHLTSKVQFSLELLLFYAVIATAVTVLDYLIPIYGTKKLGGSRYGVWGTTIGLLIGLFFFPPLGLIIGPFTGAFIGEIIYGNKTDVALKAALGSFFGFLLGTLLKLFASLLITYHSFVYLFLR